MSNALHVSSEARSFYIWSNPQYNRGLQRYNDLFRCRIEKLFVGKRILDLGCGSKAALAEDLQGSAVTVVSFSPNSATDTLLTPRAEYLPVSGIAQQLPFLSGSFDAVLASWSVPFYLPRRTDHHRHMLREVRRVLGDDGIAMMAPIGRDVPSHLTKALEAECEPGTYKIGPREGGRKLWVANSPEVFERPDIAEVWQQVMDPGHGKQQPADGVQFDLQEYDQLRNYYVQTTLKVGKVVVRDTYL